MRQRLLWSILSILPFCMFLHCDNLSDAWETAVQQNTVQAYRSFIKEYPESAYADSARAALDHMAYLRAESANTIQSYEHFLANVSNITFTARAESEIEKLLDQRGAGFREVKSILWKPVLLNEEAEYAIPALKTRIKPLLEYSGIQLTDNAEEPHQAVITVRVKGWALAGSYTAVMGNLSGRHYTGAQVEINLNIRNTDGYSWSKSFYGLSPIWRHLSMSMKKPSQAPWSSAVDSSGFCAGAATWAAEVIGPSAISNVLRRYPEMDGQFKKDLISRYETSHGPVESLAREALSDIDETVRQNSLKLLKDVQDTTFVQTYCRLLLQDPAAAVRRQAALNMKKYANECPTALLLTALEDENPLVISAVITLLGDQKAMEAVPYLADLLLSEHKDIPKHAERMLMKITDQKFDKMHRYNFMNSYRVRRDYWRGWWRVHQRRERAASRKR